MSAQVKVLSNGKVGIGTTTPKYSLLDIGKTGTSGGLTIYNSALTNPLLFKWRLWLFEFWWSIIKRNNNK